MLAASDYQGSMAEHRLGAHPWTRGTSLSDDGDVRFHRCALVICLLSGLLQKALVEFAWDVQTTLKEVGSLVKASSAEELVGGTLILARQVYASHAQRIVGTMARELSRLKGGGWSSKALRVLHSRLRGLPSGESKKCIGRGPLHTGPDWVNRIMSDLDYGRRFRLAAKVVGRAILAPSGEGESFGEVCGRLLGEAKLPGVSRYGVVGLARCIYTLRVSVLQKTPSDIRPECWRDYLRDMTTGCTKIGFDLLDVRSYDDAVMMWHGLRGMARQFYGFRHAAKWGRLALYDMPLHACEYLQILNAVGKHLGTRDHGVSCRWLISRSPSTEEAIRAMAKRLTTSTGMHPGRGDGHDFQAAGPVAAGWIKTLIGSARAATAVVTKSDLQARLRFIEQVFAGAGAPSKVKCFKCKRALGPSEVRHKLRDSRATVLCSSCYGLKRKCDDHKRKYGKGLHPRSRGRGRLVLAPADAGEQA